MFRSTRFQAALVVVAAGLVLGNVSACATSEASPAPADAALDVEVDGAVDFGDASSPYAEGGPGLDPLSDAATRSDAPFPCGDLSCAASDFCIVPCNADQGSVCLDANVCPGGQPSGGSCPGGGIACAPLPPPPFCATTIQCPGPRNVVGRVATCICR